MSVTLNTGLCHCSTCRGAAKMPASHGRPPAYPHEIEGARAEVPVEASPAPSTPPKKPVKTKIAPIFASVEEKIAYINARTDIGSALKKMQISNIMRKLKQND